MFLCDFKNNYGIFVELFVKYVKSCGFVFKYGVVCGFSSNMSCVLIFFKHLDMCCHDVVTVTHCTEAVWLVVDVCSQWGVKLRV